MLSIALAAIRDRLLVLGVVVFRSAKLLIYAASKSQAVINDRLVSQQSVIARCFFFRAAYLHFLLGQDVNLIYALLELMSRS